MAKRKGDVSLVGVLAAIIVLLGALFALYRGAIWFRDGYLVDRVEATAPQNIEEARRCFEEGKLPEAKAILQPIVTRADSGTLLIDSLMLLAEIEEQSGNTGEALSCLKRAATEFPESPQHPKAGLAYARLLEQQGQYDEALAVCGKIRESAPPELRAPALALLGRQELRDGRFWEAKQLFQQAVEDSEWDSPAWNEALDGLGEANVALVFSPAQTPESKEYVVEKGDNLTKIGMKLNTTQGMLTRANQFGPDSVLDIGDRLKYTPKEFRIVIERSACRLFLLDRGGIFKRYRVGLGMPGHETTLGSYRIGNKQKDPTWYKPNAGPIPPGDPRNELGSRWMPLTPEDESLPTDLGIHGTIAPETVGKFSSHGCARLENERVEELYDLVVRSTPVEIVDVFRPEAEK